MANSKNKKGGDAKKVGIGVGLTAAAVAAAAGAYFLYGSKDSAKNRKKVKAWAEAAKEEVVKGIKKAKTLTKEEYDELVEKASQAQAMVAKVSRADMQAFKKEMQSGWKVIAKNALGAVADVKKAAPKAAAKVAKAPAKVVKTAAKAVKPVVKKVAPAAAKKAPAKKK